MRYFKPNETLCTRILVVKELPGETSDIIQDYILQSIQDVGIQDKVVAVSSDNTNTNFGGVKRKGNKNVYTKLGTSLERKLVGVGCAAHTIHNCIKSAVDCLPVDIETVLTSIICLVSSITTQYAWKV